MVNQEPENVAGENLPIYMARRLADAERLEAVFTKAGIEYRGGTGYVSGRSHLPQHARGRILLCGTGIAGRAAAVMAENGFVPLNP